ncbi:vacuolar sorting protein 9 domain-containing protein [Cystoisospora suis]|uniref:Vacuolar sorting protein 9 domain-containing protein n=1 Tax=Cystoisospora suis TaxID=483139 RepID=A0A2C6LE09_9APIC|nr:vacuolar sorting protein 9 domain-containing protein [Cystoisospora suis]
MMDLRPEHHHAVEEGELESHERQERERMVEKRGQESSLNSSTPSFSSSSSSETVLSSSNEFSSSSHPWNFEGPPEPPRVSPTLSPLDPHTSGARGKRGEDEGILVDSCCASQLVVLRDRSESDEREEEAEVIPQQASSGTRGGERVDDDLAGKEDSDNTTSCWTRTGGDFQGPDGRTSSGRDEDAFSPWIEASSSSASSDTRVDTRSSSPIFSGNTLHALKKSGASSPPMSHSDDNPHDRMTHGSCRDTSPFAILTTSSCSQNHGHSLLHTPPRQTALPLFPSDHHPPSDDLSPRVLSSSSSSEKDHLKQIDSSLASSKSSPQSSRKPSRESAGNLDFCPSSSSVEDLGAVRRTSGTSDHKLNLSASSLSQPSSSYGRNGRPSTPATNSMSALLTLPVSPSTLFCDEASSSSAVCETNNNSSRDKRMTSIGRKGDDGEALPSTYTMISSPGGKSSGVSLGLSVRGEEEDEREGERRRRSSIQAEQMESHDRRGDGKEDSAVVNHTDHFNNGSLSSSADEPGCVSLSGEGGPISDALISAAGDIKGVGVVRNKEIDGADGEEDWKRFSSHSGREGKNDTLNDPPVTLGHKKIEKDTYENDHLRTKSVDGREGHIIQPLASAFSPPRLRKGGGGEEEEEEEEEVLGGANELSSHSSEIKENEDPTDDVHGIQEEEEEEFSERLEATDGGPLKGKDGGQGSSCHGNRQQSRHESSTISLADTASTTHIGGGVDTLKDGERSEDALSSSSLASSTRKEETGEGSDGGGMNKKHTSLILSSPSAASTSLDRARRRLELVNDAEAQKMLSTLMHPDDQEGRRFLQQVREENTVRGHTSQSGIRGDRSGEEEGSQGSGSGRPPHMNRERGADFHDPSSRGASASSGSTSGLSLGGWSWRGSGTKGAMGGGVSHQHPQQGGGGVDSQTNAAAGGGGTASRLFRAFNFGIPGFRGGSNNHTNTAGNHPEGKVSSSSSSPRTEGGKSESTDHMTGTDGWIGAEGMNGSHSGLSSLTTTTPGGAAGGPTEFERLLEAQHQQESEEKSVGGTCDTGEGGGATVVGGLQGGGAMNTTLGSSHSSGSSAIGYGTTRASPSSSSMPSSSLDGSVPGGNASEGQGVGERERHMSTSATTTATTTGPSSSIGSSSSSTSSTDPGVRSSTSSDLSDTSSSFSSSYPRPSPPPSLSHTAASPLTTTPATTLHPPLPLSHSNKNLSQDHYTAVSSSPANHLTTPSSTGHPQQAMTNGAGGGGGGSTAVMKPRTPYNVFLDRLKHPSCALVVASVKRFVETFPPSLTREQAARRIHPFLSQTQASLLKAEVFANFARTETDQQQVMEGLERFVLQKLHGVLFRDTPEDMKENAYLRRKIFCLSSWVELHHLEIPDLPNISALSLGAREIKRLDKMKCPRDKLVLILNCCRVIIAVLDAARKASGCDTPPAADDLLPLLIYTLLQARPHSLHSHIQFISYFRHPSRLVSEEAYFFTHFCSAVEFVKVVGVQPGVALNGVSPEEFEARMQVAEEEYQRFLTSQAAEHEEDIGSRKEVQDLQHLQKNNHHSSRGDVNDSSSTGGPVRSHHSTVITEAAFSSSSTTTKISNRSSSHASPMKPTSKIPQAPVAGAPAALAAAASALSTLEHLSVSSSNSSSSTSHNDMSVHANSSTSHNTNPLHIIEKKAMSEGLGHHKGGGGKDFVVYRRQGIECFLKELSNMPRTFENVRSIDDLRIKDLHALLQEYQQMSMILSQVTNYLGTEHLNVPHRK